LLLLGDDSILSRAGERDKEGREEEEEEEEEEEGRGDKGEGDTGDFIPREDLGLSDGILINDLEPAIERLLPPSTRAFVSSKTAESFLEETKLLIKRE
jgi:hypothetical protein